MCSWYTRKWLPNDLSSLLKLYKFQFSSIYVMVKWDFSSFSTDFYLKLSRAKCDDPKALPIQQCGPIFEIKVLANVLHLMCAYQKISRHLNIRSKSFQIRNLLCGRIRADFVEVSTGFKQFKGVTLWVSLKKEKPPNFQLSI